MNARQSWWRKRKQQEADEIRAMEMLLGARWNSVMKCFVKYRELGQGMMTTDRWDRQGNLLDWDTVI